MQQRRASCRKPSPGALGNQLALKLGESGEDAEREAPVGGGRVDLRTGPSQHLQADISGAQILDRIDQMTQVAAEPVEFPEHQRVAGLDRFEARGPGRASWRPDARSS